MHNYNESFKYYDKKIEEANESPGASTAYGSKKSRLMRYHTAVRLPTLDSSTFSGDSVLDIGCGPGHFLDFLSLKGALGFPYGAPASYLGIEPHPKMFSLIWKREASNIERYKNIEFGFRNCDVFEIEKTYDWVIANCIFASAFSADEQENFEIFLKTVTKMWSLADKGLCFDVTRGASTKVEHEVEPGYNELVFTPYYVQKIIESLGCKRWIVDCSTSTRYMSFYLYKREQVYDRVTAEELE